MNDGWTKHFGQVTDGHFTFNALRNSKTKRKPENKMNEERKKIYLIVALSKDTPTLQFLCFFPAT